MQIRFTQDWRRHKIGETVDYVDGLCDVLVRVRKVAVYVVAEPAGRVPETADFKPRGRARHA